jgi:ribosomal protein S18 acetylase RimI-like enzyme
VAEVREVHEADLPRLREIFLQSRREAFHWNDPAIYRLEDFDAQTEGERMLVGEIDGEVAGFISWWAPENFIHHLYIDAAFKRRGLGRALLDACLQCMERPAQLKCVSRNAPALAFYKALGWNSVATGHSDEGEYQLLQFDDGVSRGIPA